LNSTDEKTDFFFFFTKFVLTRRYIPARRI